VISDPKALKRALMLAKSLSARVDPGFGNVKLPTFKDGGGVENATQMGINVATDKSAGRRYADLIVDGKKTYESRASNSLKPYIGKRVSIVRTGEGPAKAIGEVTVGEPIVVDEKQFRDMEHQHLVPKGSAFDITTGTKHLYPMHDPVRYEQERDVGHGIIARQVIHKEWGGGVDQSQDHHHRKTKGKSAKPLILDPIERDVNLGKFLHQSKVRDAEGNHKILYHATPKDFTAFRPGGDEPHASGEAIWMSPYKDQQNAGWRIGGHQGKFNTGVNVMPVYANIKNPLVLDTPEMREWAKDAYAAGDNSFPLTISPKTKQALIDDGYDGIFHGGHDPVEYAANNLGIGDQPTKDEEVIAFHPHQIKSAIGNNGHFDPNENEIHKANGGGVDQSQDPDYLPQGHPERAANLARHMAGSKAPNVLYHGATTGLDRNKFVTGSNMGRKRFYPGELGAWFGSEPEIANVFSKNTGAVFPVHARITNPKEYSSYFQFQNSLGKRKSALTLQKDLIKQGYDGIVIRNSNTDFGGQRDDWVAFHPTQIKSAVGNNGQFDPTKPGIHKVRGGEVLHRIHSDTITKATGGIVDPQKAIRKALMIARIAKDNGGSLGMNDDAQPQRQLNPQGLYSAAAEAAMALPQVKGSPQQMIASLKGVKPEELKWSGVRDAFADRKSVTKDELAAHFKKMLPQITENQANRFQAYSTEGGKNYRELLLRGVDPATQQEYSKPPTLFQSSHWDEPNVLAHLRMSDRQDVAPVPRVPKPDTTQTILVRGEKYIVPAWSSGVPGLVIHKKLDDKKTYNLTHAKSGLAVANSLTSYWGARNLANLISPHADWTQPADLLKNIYTEMPEEKLRRLNLINKLQYPVSKNPELHQPPPDVMAAYLKKRKFQQPEAPKKHLLLDELQSDWGQAGRDKGFKKSKEEMDALHQKNIEEYNATIARYPALAREISRPNYPIDRGVSPAPYIGNTQNWTDLGLKRALWEAAKGGHDSLAWTPGQNHADRYSLRKYVKDLFYDHDTGRLRAIGHRGETVFDKEDIKPENLGEHVGKEVAEKLLNEGEQATVSNGVQGKRVSALRGQNLQVGGEGMLGYYDKFLPRRLMELAKEHDPDVNIEPLKSTDKRVNGFPSIKISDKMRQSILKNGFKAYKRGGDVDG
jgi:hypothetical protein